MVSANVYRTRAGEVLKPCEMPAAIREAASDVLGWLRDQGIYDDGGVSLSQVEATPSRNARQAEDAAPGAPDDAVVWDAVLDSAYGARYAARGRSAPFWPSPT